MAPQQSGLRPPQQRRSRESLERALAAGERILAREGYEGFTIAQVSREAKVSVGSLYGRFENKDALIRAIHRRMLDRLEPADGTGGEPDEDPPADLEAAVRRAVHALADGMDRERGILRVFMLRGAVDAAISGPGSTSSQAVARAFKRLVLEHGEEIAHPERGRAVDVAFRMAYDVLARHVMYGPTFESETEIAWDDLVEELILASVAYLRFAGT